jgi:hypothetical protein
MLGVLGVSTMIIQYQDIVFFYFGHQTGLAVRFYTQGLLYKSVFDALLISLSLRSTLQERPLSYVIVVTHNGIVSTLVPKDAI